jgi:hypothetical protein
VYRKTYHVFFSVIRVMTTCNGHSDSASYAVQDQKGRKKFSQVTYYIRQPCLSLTDSSVTLYSYSNTPPTFPASSRRITCHLPHAMHILCAMYAEYYHYRKCKFGHQFTSIWKVSVCRREVHNAPKI